jgi:hypothetical protein
MVREDEAFSGLVVKAREHPGLRRPGRHHDTRLSSLRLQSVFSHVGGLSAEKLRRLLTVGGPV